MNIVEKINDALQFYPKRVRDILERDGDVQIKSMVIYRKPIMKAIDTVLNLLSLGKFKDIENNPHDTLFHLFMVVELTNGKKYLIEKNQTINITTDIPDLNATDVQSVEVNQMWLQYLPDGTKRILTMQNMLNETRERMGSSFFKYDPWTANCQNFILNILKANALSDPVLEDFIYQNIDRLVRALPSYTKWFSKFLTDLGSIFDYGRQELGFKKGGIVKRKLKNQSFFPTDESSRFFL